MVDKARRIKPLVLKGEKRSKKTSKKSPDDLQKQQGYQADVIYGSGRVVTSGTSVQGFETKFKEEVEVGDEIIICVDEAKPESRIVTGIISQRCLTIHSAFSSDCFSTTSYKIKKDSTLLYESARGNIKQASAFEKKISSQGLDGEISETLLQDEISKQLQEKISKSKSIAVIRQKTGMWGYKTIKKELKHGASAEQLLDIRSKLTRDKYCW